MPYYSGIILNSSLQLIIPKTIVTYIIDACLLITEDIPTGH